MESHSHIRQLTPQEGGYDSAGYYRVSAYELITGWLTGYEAGHEHDGPLCPSPRAGLERALLPALRRAPCVIAFSGGRDSSALLAVAAHLARRESLPDPLPVTHDFAGSTRADESAYQESLVRELGLRDWVRLRERDSCEILGPPARRGLLRHGLLWPATLHSTAPMIALAAGGGSLVTGQGGDEVLGTHRLSGLNRLVASGYHRRKAMGTLLASSSPLRVRQHQVLRMVRSHGDPFAYLPPAVAAEANSRIARDQASAPLRWNHAVLRVARRRAARVSATNLQQLCGEADVTYHEPLLDSAFLKPLARAGGMRGWASRTDVMRYLFEDVLTERICTRLDKADLSAEIVGATTRDFLATWDGTGVDSELVDVDSFRALATRPNPPFTALLLVQAAWLATQDGLSNDRSHESVRVMP